MYLFTPESRSGAGTPAPVSITRTSLTLLVWVYEIYPKGASKFVLPALFASALPSLLTLQKLLVLLSLGERSHQLLAHLQPEPLFTFKFLTVIVQYAFDERHRIGASFAYLLLLVVQLDRVLTIAFLYKVFV